MGGLLRPFKEKRLKKRIYVHLIKREGCCEIVYRDSLGHLTVGVGHLVTPSDSLYLGNKISVNRIQEFLEIDTEEAFMAAKEQAIEIGIETEDFVLALTSVNFQLGIHWNHKFYDSYPLLVTGDWKAAVRKLKNTLWAKQTPVRTKDFTEAIEKAFTMDK